MILCINYIRHYYPLYYNIVLTVLYYIIGLARLVYSVNYIHVQQRIYTVINSPVATGPRENAARAAASVEGLIIF